MQSDVLSVQEAPASTISRRLSYYSVLTRFPLPTHMHFFDIYMYGIHAVPRLQLREDTRARPHSRRPRVRVGHAQVLYTRMRVGTMALAFFSCVFPRCWLPAIHRSLLLGDGARPCWSKGTTGFRSFRAEPRGVRLRPSGGAGGPGTARPACLGDPGRGCGSATGAGRTAGVPAGGASAARLVEHAEGDGGICAPSLGGSWMCRLLLSSSKT